MALLGELLAFGKAMQALAALGLFGILNVSADVSAQANLLLNVVTIAIAVGVAIPALKSKRKDATIKDLNDALQAKTEALAASELQKRQLEQGAQHCKQEATRWQAKYEEASNYTAEEAVKHFEAALEAHSGRVAERHEVLIRQGEATASSLASIAATLERIERRE
jgi:predicted lipid-binding transport protein (Tim44 family)